MHLCKFGLLRHYVNSICTCTLIFFCRWWIFLSITLGRCFKHIPHIINPIALFSSTRSLFPYFHRLLRSSPRLQRKRITISHHLWLNTLVEIAQFLKRLVSTSLSTSTKKHWVGVCVDVSLSQVLVLDCNTSVRTDGMINKELRPISEMFPYLLRRAAKLGCPKNLKALNIERPVSSLRTTSTSTPVSPLSF